MRKTIYTLALAALLGACTHTISNPTMVGSQPLIYPDYSGVTIPAGIAPLNFNYAGGEAEIIDVRASGSKGGEVHTQGKWANFDIGAWHKLTERNRGGQIAITVSALEEGKWLQYAPFYINVSTDSIGDWGLTYRRVAPGYVTYSRMGIYQRELSSWDEEAILENTQTGGMCINCHTANRTNPDQFVFHVRGKHGATMIQENGKRTWLQAKNADLGGSMVYPYWHPSGEYCAFSTNNTTQGFHSQAQKGRIEVYDLHSDVFVYHPKTREIITSPLLQTKDWSENVPTFSPDGRTLYFITAKQKDYPLEFEQQRYNLCSISFDPQTATFGDHVDTLFRADKMGKSITWPRPSYDGKFMLFTMLDYGYFSVWHDEAEQWLMDLETRNVRPLTEANSSRSESYHNWSTNSRWIVFTSRRDDGLYTRLYICHIDENGKTTKPFLLPQENPWEYYFGSLFSFNTPDFASRPAEFDNYRAGLEIVSDRREATTVRKGNEAETME